MNPTAALPGSMTWMGIRLSSGSRCPQSPKGFHCTDSIGFPCENRTAFAPTESSNLHSITHLASCQSRNPPTISSDESIDRKSTRLNSSHLGISYAVFCLKKKKKLACTDGKWTTGPTAALDCC